MAKVKRVIAKPDDVILFDAVDVVLNGQDPYSIASRRIIEMGQESDFSTSRTPEMDSRDNLAALPRLVEKRKR